MLSDDLYKNKYLKYKNKYLNLKSQVGGVVIDGNYIDSLIKCLNYTRSIFRYLDKFYMLPESDVLSISTIKGLLIQLIYALKQNLTAYKNHLHEIYRVIKTENVLQDVPLESVVVLVDLERNDALKQLDENQPTNQYDEYYWKILNGVDETSTFINTLLTQRNNLKYFKETLKNIIYNITLFISYLTDEINKRINDRTSIIKGQRIVYTSPEEKKKRERLRSQQNLTEDKEQERAGILDSNKAPDYGANPLN